ncbi:lysozyme inhibitor LprI family protein [Ancylobacter mangrovi]|uniref:lysozyme inhibitor LprI family protein n=1 Tax=Ancylobacter mangrovi TaxID=2972472 RepID=UPI002161AE40|nr:hypothetical protein [Ancylobacter mangrovi]MCS0501830.1 hypothetical protein [Ancylobacter mangrovi]
MSARAHTAAALVVAAVLVAAGAAASPASAASFDCGKARTPDERAVCTDPALSALDSEMGALWFAYSRMPLLMGASGARRDDARTFLSDRAACGANTPCLTALYHKRNATLKQQLGGAIETLTKEANADPAPTAPAPRPVMDQVSTLFAQCRNLGGELKGNAWPELMSADIDHDGQPDYVLNAQNLQCDGAATAYCANNGCDIWVDLSSAGFAPMKLRGSHPTLVQGVELTTLDIWVDKSQCADLPTGAACWGTWKWDGSALKASYAARPG